MQHNGKAIASLAPGIIGLVFTVDNSAIGACLGTTNQLF